MLLAPEKTASAAKEPSSNACLSGEFFLAGAFIGLLHSISSVVGFGRGFEMVTVATNLVNHGAFADPFDAGLTGPTAANPPLYPLLLALFLKIFGSPSLFAGAAIVGNILANAVTASLLPRLSYVLFGDARPGMFASIGCLAAMQLLPAWDTSYTVAGLILFCLFSAATLAPETRTVRNAVFAGLGAGILALLNPSSLLIVVPWIAYLAARRRSRSVAVYCCILCATLCLVVSMWVARNEIRLGSPVIRTNFGMSIYASNNDCATSSLVENERYGCYQRHHPNTSREEAQLVRTLGEVAYDRKRTAEALDWMATHPGRFRRLTGERVLEFWFPSWAGHQFTTTVVWVITALSIPGLILMVWRREPAAVLLLAVLLVYPLMYYIVVTDSRYRYPVLWISALAAGYLFRAAPFADAEIQRPSAQLAPKL
jgi:Dolichyl-phosphate-mannose-protein mannosyltransferase